MYKEKKVTEETQYPWKPAAIVGSIILVIGMIIGGLGVSAVAKSHTKVQTIIIYCHLESGLLGMDCD